MNEYSPPRLALVKEQVLQIPLFLFLTSGCLVITSEGAKHLLEAYTRSQKATPVGNFAMFTAELFITYYGGLSSLIKW